VNARFLAWSICVLTLLAVAGTTLLAFINRASIQTLDETAAAEIVLPVGFGILGALVASREARNATGWIFLAMALAMAFNGVTAQYTRYALVTDPQAPFTPWIPWLGSIALTLVYPGGLGPIALLLVPNGRLLSPRWRWVTWSSVGVTVLLVLATVLDPRGLDLRIMPGTPNPTGVPAFEGLAASPLGIGLYLLGLVVVAAAGVAIVLRLRRSQGEEALQLRWIAWATAFAVFLNVGLNLGALLIIPLDQVNQVVTVTTVAGFGIAMPLGFAVAMLRYRLYDLDLFLNRTALYGAVSAVLLVVFGAAEVVAQGALQAWFGQGSNLMAAVVGLGAGLAFAPVRHRLRPIVDRALPARSRLTLFFTDIVESTQAIVDLGDERWREVLDAYRAAVRQELARYRGREVNTAGDAFFAVFNRPANAIRCAVAMRDSVGNLGLRVRTGLHLGDVEMRGEQVSGLAVHAAARVMGSAGAGNILVTAELSAALPDVAVEDRGPHTLRGVPGEWQLFEVTATP
jgi:class 3 adenylate cyclase